MEWWLEGEDTTYYSKNGISLAARFVRKQTGFARQKAEEYYPKELRGTDAKLYTEETVRIDHGWADTDDDDDSQWTALIGSIRVAADPLSGIKLLMAAYKDCCGRETPHCRQELRDEY